MNVTWQGVFPAATTQFQPDQALDLPATMAHIGKMIDAGIHGLIMLGTVGENCSLLYEEKLEVLRATVRHVGGRLPVLSGVAECSTALACRFAADAQKLGVDGLMVLPAMVYKSDPRETIAHFRAVARATSLPIMVYNNPVSYSVDITPEMFVELADQANLVAIKESSENVRRITDLKNLCGDRYILFCGVDDLVLESILLGATGWVSGLVNAFPAENRLLWDLATAGRWDEAREVYRWYTPLLHLDTHVKLVQYIKLAQQECGLGSELVRAPRLTLVGEERERVLAIIRHGIATRPGKVQIRTIVTLLAGSTGGSQNVQSRISVIDTHTGGEPTRIVTAGGPDLGSGTMAERLAVFRDRHDTFRSAVVNEPRGSDVMVGAILLPPVDPECVAGVIFFNNIGYLGMCGHGTIGVAVALAYLGRIGPGSHRLETPVGRVTITLEGPNTVTIDNVDSYRLAKDVSVTCPGSRRYVGDVAWGGNWFFLVHDHGETLSDANVERLTEVTWRIRQALTAAGITGTEGAEIDHIELFGPPDRARRRQQELRPLPRQGLRPFALRHGHQCQARVLDRRRQAWPRAASGGRRA